MTKNATMKGNNEWVNPHDCYTFNDIKDPRLRLRNRATVLANLIEDAVRQGNKDDVVEDMTLTYLERLDEPHTLSLLRATHIQLINRSLA